MAEFAEAMNVIGSGGSAVHVEEGAVLANAHSRFQHAVETGNAYAWASQTYDPDGHDTIIAVENNNPDKLLYIWRIFISSDTASRVTVFTANGDTMTGTAVPGTNLNRKFNKVALATGICDETGNAEQAGGYLTWVLFKVIGVDTVAEIAIDGAIALPNDYMVGIDLETAATAANGVIFGWYE